MRLNIAGLSLIKAFEGLELSAYKDPIGILTIGYGHTGPRVQPGMKISAADAEALLQNDVSRFEDAVASLVKVPINENEFAALVSLAFNIGAERFKDSTTLRRLNKGDRLGAAEALEWFNKGRINGKLTTLPGLTRRRAAERALFLMTPPDIQPAPPSQLPITENAGIPPSTEQSPRREHLTDSRTLQGAGIAGAGGGGAAVSSAIEKSGETAKTSNETISPQMQRIYELIQAVPDWVYWSAAALVVFGLLIILWSRLDDWRHHRR